MQVTPPPGGTGAASRRFREFRDRTRDSWRRSRRVAAKAEHLAKGPNRRFMVTSLGRGATGPQRLYEEPYCARGDMEKRIKEQQTGHVADRTSTATLRANQLRLYFASFAYVLMHGLRRLGLAGTRWARAQCGTLRVKLLNVAARVRVTARKVWLSFPSVYPYRDEFAAAAAALCRGPARAPPAARPDAATATPNARFQRHGVRKRPTSALRDRPRDRPLPNKGKTLSAVPFNPLRRVCETAANAIGPASMPTQKCLLKKLMWPPNQS